jgi:transposase-like protein
MTPNCPYCSSQPQIVRSAGHVIRTGHFRRSSDSRKIQRFTCRLCKKGFSFATFSPCVRQKKRRLNIKIFELLASGVSQRRIARLLRINKNTVARKFLFVGRLSDQDIDKMNKEYPPAEVVEFDEMETFEHTRLKPLSILAAVESRTRRVLGYQVASMPAKGLLAERSLKKYGPREDNRALARAMLFSSLKEIVKPNVLFKSDQNPHYPKDVKRFFPKATHIRYLGRKPAHTGQGELKQGGFDPIFTFNHTAAMKRENINRLKRKTWSTTKKAENLRLHLAIFALYHNETYLKYKKKKNPLESWVA